MSDEKERFDRVVQDLKRQRDEIRLQIHLAKAEAQDEWNELEKKWEEMKPKLSAATNEAVSTSRNLFSALSLAAEEIRNGYSRIKKHLD